MGAKKTLRYLLYLHFEDPLCYLCLVIVMLSRLFVATLR